MSAGALDEIMTIGTFRVHATCPNDAQCIAGMSPDAEGPAFIHQVGRVRQRTRSLRFKKARLPPLWRIQAWFFLTDLNWAFPHSAQHTLECSRAISPYKPCRRAFRADLTLFPVSGRVVAFLGAQEPTLEF